MDKFLTGAISLKPDEPKKKRARAHQVSTSAGRRPSSPAHGTGGDLLKKIIPNLHKRKAPIGIEDSPSKPEQNYTTIQQPATFAMNNDPSAQSSYLLSIFPGKEADRWHGDNQSQAKYCMKHLVALNSGLAGLLHGAIGGEIPSSAEFQKLKDAHGAAISKTEVLQAELQAEKTDMRQAEKIKSLERDRNSEVARYQKEIDALNTQLDAIKLEKANREAPAQLETREGFLASPSGTRFLDIYRKKVLALYHESMNFLGVLFPAATEYLVLGATRALEQARTSGNLESFDKAALLSSLPNPSSWTGNPELPLDHPWWEPALDAALGELELEENDEAIEEDADDRANEDVPADQDPPI